MSEARIAGALHSGPSALWPLAHAGYRPDIDGLRAVAVLSVVGFHAFPDWVRGGFVGVDIFFVISGYLISTIILQNLAQGSFSFADFYARRIRRIFPALLTLLVLCLAFGWVALLADEYKVLGKHIAAGAAFVANLALWRENSYFDNAAADDKPLLHLWSLGVEEQFYIVWPFLLWFAWRRRLALPVVIGSVLFISFLLNVSNVAAHPVATFYTPATRFWELATGSLLAWHWQQRRGQDGRSAEPLAMAGLLLLAAALLFIGRESLFPGWLALLPVVGAVALIHAGPRTRLSRVLLCNRVLVWIGLISYPLYLWHWPLLSFARIVLSETPPLQVRVAAVVAALLLAWLTYELIEKPLRFGPHRGTKALALASALAVAGSAGLAIFVSEGVKSREQAARYAALDYNLHWQGWSRCEIVRAPDKDGGCKMLHPDRPVDAVVLGDSHAGHLGAGLRELFEARGRNAAVMLYAGCYPVLPVRVRERLHFDCPGHLIADAVEFAVANADVKTVILSGYPALQLQKYRYHERRTISQAQLQENLTALRTALDVTLARLTRAGKAVVVFMDNPELLKDPRSCVARWWITAPRCELDISRAGYLARNAEFLELVAQYRSRYPSVIFVNEADALCKGDTCYGYRDGALLYSSRDHLTPAGSRLVVSQAAPLLAAALGERDGRGGQGISETATSNETPSPR